MYSTLKKEAQTAAERMDDEVMEAMEKRGLDYDGWLEGAFGVQVTRNGRRKMQKCRNKKI